MGLTCKLGGRLSWVRLRMKLELRSSQWSLWKELSNLYGRESIELADSSNFLIEIGTENQSPDKEFTRLLSSTLKWKNSYIIFDFHHSKFKHLN